MLCSILRKNGISLLAQSSALALVVAFFSSPLLAETTTSSAFANSKTQAVTPQKSFLSDFDLSIINRYWLAPESQNNVLSNELALHYSLNDSFSIGVSAEYDQMTSVQNAEGSDFQDTDVSINYYYSPSSAAKQSVSWDMGASLMASVPTSRSSQNQNEYGGGAVKGFFDVIGKQFVFTVSSRFYEYFYENSYIPSTTPNGAAKSEPDNQPDVPPTFVTSPLTITPQLIANCNSYSDSSFISLLRATPSFMLRNEVRFESLGYFDNHNSNTFHDKYGIGYKFDPEFVLWVSQDANKNTDLGGSIFDSKYITTIVSIYWKI